MASERETKRSRRDRVLVTGATGFLGRATAAALARAGHIVLRGARVAPVGIGAGTGKEWISHGDVGPDTHWEEALREISAVVHLAGLSDSLDEPELHRVNAQGTERLAQAAASAGVQRLILVSSAHVHGQASRGRPFQDGDPPAPETPYARSKLDGETRLREAAASGAMQWVILRSPMVYGPGVDGNFGRLVRLVRAGVPLPLGAGTAPKSFIGVDNFACAVVRCVEHPRAVNQTFLVADAETTSTLRLVQQIAAALGRRAWTPYVPPLLVRAALAGLGRLRDANRLFDPLELDTSRIRTLLDWTPPVSLAEGVRRAVERSAAHSKAGSMGTR